MLEKFGMATTHVDEHSEKISIEALKDFVDSVNQQYTPIGVEHDPRIPPIGRVISAQIEELPDGEFAVDRIAEIFEEGQEIEFRDDGREIPIRSIGEGITISPDRSYVQPNDKELLRELEELLKCQIKSQIKKSVEPISILIIAASFTAGEIAQGLLSKIGEDIWEKVKGKINELVNSETHVEKDRLLVFEFTVDLENNPLSLEATLTNPSESEIREFLDEGLEQLDKKTDLFSQDRHYLKKVVLEYKDNKMRVIFGLRVDGVPLPILHEVTSDQRSRARACGLSDGFLPCFYGFS